jgi:hypothetical protein
MILVQDTNPPACRADRVGINGSAAWYVVPCCGNCGFCAGPFEEPTYAIAHPG